MQTIETIISAALDNLTPRQRVGYAGDVLRGAQNWSGSDLAGKARRYSARYASQRRDAARALHAAGGCIVPVEHGRLVSAVRIGADDYGAALYNTAGGTYAATASPRLARLV